MFCSLRSACTICDSCSFFIHKSDVAGMGNCAGNLSKCKVNGLTTIHFSGQFSWDERNFQECAILLLESPVYDCYSGILDTLQSYTVLNMV